MAQDDQKQEKQAAAEERDEILEEANENDSVDMSAISTPEDSESAGGHHVERDPEVAEEAADELSEEIDETSRTTKAGRRSAKAQREAEEEEQRKAAAQDRSQETPKPRVIQKPNPLKRHGKAYRAAAGEIDKSKQYELAEAIDLTKKTAKTKFDPSVELHVNLGVDPRQADQMVRSTVTLPAGTGKKLRIAVVAGADKHADARKAGADTVSDGSIIADIEKGQMDFDVLIATPDMMPQLGRVARVLGPRGLMPNPKSGTVTPNVAQAVEQAKGGKVEFRIDKQSIVHLAVGKASFSNDQLDSNIKAAIDAILKAKPATAKGTYVKNISMATSMGPGIKLDVQQTIAAANPRK